MQSIVCRDVRQRCACTARARGQCEARGKRRTRLIDREKQFAHGCELVGV